VVALAEHSSSMNALTAKYLNRASDLLFVLARFVNRERGDVLWVPGANRTAGDPATRAGRAARTRARPEIR
jgi:hypothetical protein